MAISTNLDYLGSWPRSDTERFMSRTDLIGIKAQTQIIYTGWIDSVTDLNCTWIKFKGRKMLISVKLLTKYVIIISALGSVHEKFGFWIKAVPKSLQNRQKYFTTISINFPLLIRFPFAQKDCENLAFSLKDCFTAGQLRLYISWPWSLILSSNFSKMCRTYTPTHLKNARKSITQQLNHY